MKTHGALQLKCNDHAGDTFFETTSTVYEIRGTQGTTLGPIGRHVHSLGLEHRLTGGELQCIPGQQDRETVFFTFNMNRCIICIMQWEGL